MASTLMMLAANATSKASGATGTPAPAWRQFPFFDVIPVKDVHDLDSPPDIFKATPEISTVISSSSGVLVADIHGSIHLLNRDFEPVNSWIAHVGGRVTHMVEQKDILVTLGEEDSIRSPLLKIWDMQTFDKTGAPILLRSTKLQLSNRPHPVTTVALSATLSHLAIGLGDGTVILYRHLDQSLSSSTSLTSLPKIRTVHESPTEPITGLGFREPTEEVPNLYLFVVTTNRVLCYQASGKGSGGAPNVVDEIGTGLGCASMDWRGRDVVVARDEAIYVCNTEGRGNCWAYEGSKSSIHTHLNYLVIVSPPFIPTASAASATVRNYVARSANSGETDITKVTVFDPENKIVAYSGPFRQGVREVVSQWGNIYILTSDGQLLCLQEKSTADKLDMLYRKTQFPLALNVAKTQNLDDSSVVDIHRQYGDHLYLKGDYDGAMQQFVQTIGHLQPSYVIRKYLDAQRIHNLVTYLQELHSLGRANSDHTTLLLNTYTKLKDVTRLDSFIKTEAKRSTDAASGELPFDLDTAIRVCRQAGYFEHAAWLARKYERHEDYLRIQIEDAQDFRDAGAYLRMLGPEAAESNLARYGRAMLHSLPEETTQLLIDLCTTTGSLVEPEESTTPVTKQPPVVASSAGYLSYLALNRNQQTSSSASDASPPSPSIKTVRPENVSSSGTTTPPLATTLAVSTTPTTTAAPAATSVVAPQSLPQPVKLPSPRVYFAHFVDHMEQFVVFLETVAYRRYGQSVDGGSIVDSISTQRVRVRSEAASPVQSDGEDKEDQVAIWNTLLELYLTLPGESDGTAGQGVGGELKGKAMKVLRSHVLPYDPTHALILCSTYGFTEGLVLLWEKLGMYEDIIRFWIEKSKMGGDTGASMKVVEGLMMYGRDRPELYPLVLRFLTSTPELLGKHREDLRGILEYVEEEGIMPPLGVVQLLSRNGVASVGLVKEWLMMRIRESKEEIENDKNLVRSYRLETAEKLKQVEELTDTEHPKVFHVTRCAICKAQLDLPAVHFMCNHSYHQRCLQEHDTECPNCAREHGVIREIRKNNERLADQHDVFLAEVQERGFEAVATVFSRGILNMPRTEDIV
ncbi:hypothetical protein P691DRAFT_760788 [Macrolepiota fuliginosa MF-IS2]|uniref:E3 ubiquitin-protein ligase PEP5 n=1 Tax=Macrolepiota fuliginosa MF-IS2 TaxID=1400762 RepID=A0A9P5XDR0_9AGAR|nr:hypothetical protein P691DRAFT_760788 [Macrolepiota fuliginosa MF-IS2]